MYDLSDSKTVRALLRDVAETVRGAEARAQQAEARADGIAGATMRLLALVEQRLNEATDRVAAAEARAFGERRSFEERLAEAEGLARRAESRADAAEEVLARLREVLDGASHADPHGAGPSISSLH
jgi:hypothetical protein